MSIQNLTNSFSGKKIFITGHTGFKGSWLAFLLHELGAEVMGFGLAPETSDNHFDLLKLEGKIKHVIGDKKGIFVAKRNFINFFGILNNIKKNYKRIQKDMKKNKLPTNKEFLEKFVKSIDDFK